MAGKRPCIIPSKAFKAYEKLAKGQLAAYPVRYTGPIEVTCLYYLQTARMPDLTNLTGILSAWTAAESWAKTLSHVLKLR
jgi:uncharacterized membrane protein